MKSVFTDKNAEPAKEDLQEKLGQTYSIWKSLEKFTKKIDPATTEKWNFSGEKFGWSYRIKDGKRILLYMLPRDKFFKVAFVFGQKAVDQVLESDISETIKAELKSAKKYAEGRGIRIEVKDHSTISDIEKLIRIKIAN